MLNRISHYVKVCDNVEPGIVLKVKSLEIMYMDIFSHRDVEYTSQVSRFVNELISKNDNLHIVQPENNFNKTLLICFKSNVALLVSHRLNTSNFLKLIWKVVIPIRGRTGKVDNELSNKFNLENQLHSVPIPLLELIRLLVDGVRVDNMKYSQATLSISLLTVSNFHKKINKNNLQKHRRNILCRETPLMLFNFLRMYASIQSRTLVDSYFQTGLCASYDHVLHVTKGISDNLVRKFKTHGIFAPGELKRDVFTMVAKDNVDHNAMSSITTKHFHGANMTVMQTPTPGKTGTNISNVEETTVDTSDTPESIENTAANGLNSLATKEKLKMKRIEPIPKECTEPPYVYFPKLVDGLYAVPCPVADSKYDANDMDDKGVSNEITWLDTVASSLSSQSIDPWSKHHSNLKRQVPDLPGIYTIVPLMNAAVHTLQTQHHCMQYIKRSVNFFNHGQTPVDMCDQPVYALTKEIHYSGGRKIHLVALPIFGCLEVCTSKKAY